MFAGCTSFRGLARGRNASSRGEWRSENGRARSTGSTSRCMTCRASPGNDGDAAELRPEVE